MAKPKFQQPVTPKVTAKFTFLNKPQDPYQGKGDPEYKLRMLMEDTEANREWITNLIEKAKKEAKDNGIKLKKVFKSPFNYPEDQDEDDYVTQEGADYPVLDEDHQGKIFFQAKSKYKPGLVDAALNSLPESVRIMGGDEVKAKVEVIPYDGLGSGISLRLKTVQLIEKNASYSTGPNTEGMEAEEGYVAEQSDEDDDDEQEDF